MVTNKEIDVQIANILIEKNHTKNWENTYIFLKIWKKNENKNQKFLFKFFLFNLIYLSISIVISYIR